MNVPFLHFFSLRFHKFSLFSSFSWLNYEKRSRGAVKGVAVHCNSCHFLGEQPPPPLQFVEVRTRLTVLSTFFYNLSSGGEGKGSSEEQVKKFLLSLFAHNIK